LIEAMSRGCPALASQCADIPSLLPKYCLIKPSDSTTLAKLITHSITHPDWLHKQAVINWNKAAEYSKSILDRKRTEFWSSFADYVQSYYRDGGLMKSQLLSSVIQQNDSNEG
jgi:hypothetical protein